MSDALTTTDKPGDPADKAADGAFGGVHSHRAGYGDDKLQRVIGWLRERPLATLASGEGGLLLAENDRLRADLAEARAEIDRMRRILAALQDCKVRRWWTRLSKPTDASHDDYADARAEIVRLRQRADRAERILAALRGPSDAVVNVAWEHMDIIRAAVAAAEQEVDA